MGEIYFYKYLNIFHTRISIYFKNMNYHNTSKEKAKIKSKLVRVMTHRWLWYFCYLPASTQLLSKASVHVHCFVFLSPQYHGQGKFYSCAKIIGVHLKGSSFSARIVLILSQLLQLACSDW